MEIFVDDESFAADYRRGGRSEDDAIISLLTLDPPEADAYRAIVRELLRPRRCGPALADSESWLADWIRTNIGRELDLVSDLCLPLSLRFIADVIGLGAVNEDILQASEAVVRSMFSGLEPTTYAPGMAARSDLSRMLTEAAQSAKHGILAALKHHPDLPYLANSMRVVLLAGINSTSRSLGLALLTLLSGPSLRSLPSSEGMLTAVNELIRFDGPFQAMSRVAVHNIEFHGHTFRSGQEVICLVGSANRDEAAFPQPEALLLDRKPNAHLAFGHGVHACVGARLAISLAAILLSCLRRLAPDTIRLGPAVIDRNPTLRGVVQLPALLQ